jgi:hypothetical protein
VGLATTLRVGSPPTGHIDIVVQVRFTPRNSRRMRVG